MSQRIFVTGIGTGVGKTVVAAILVRALGADYWKPIQAGTLDQTDTHRILSLVGESKGTIHPEAFRLTQPASPNIAAERDGVRIDADSIVCPASPGPIIIEGAGGLLVPINDETLMIDLIVSLECGVVVVSRNYLGSINHTLLTVQALKARRLPILGIVFTGEPFPEGEETIARITRVPVLFRVEQEEIVDAAMVDRHARRIRPEIAKWI